MAWKLHGQYVALTDDDDPQARPLDEVLNEHVRPIIPENIAGTLGSILPDVVADYLDDGNPDTLSQKLQDIATTAGTGGVQTVADDAILTPVVAVPDTLRPGFVVTVVDETNGRQAVFVGQTASPELFLTAGDPNFWTAGTSTLSAGGASGVDGKVNVWAESGHTLGLKNRLGEAAIFTVVVQLALRTTAGITHSEAGGGTTTAETGINARQLISADFSADGDTTKTVTQVLRHGGYFKSGGAGAAERTVADRLGEVVSVKDRGATGDGATDDYAAIVAAHDYVRDTLGGGAVFFPPGTYMVSQPLLIDRRVNLLGSGVYSVIRATASFPATMTVNTRTFPAAILYLLSTPSTRNHIVEKIALRGGVDTSNIYAGHGLIVQGAANREIRSVDVIYSSSHAMVVDNVQNSAFHNLRVDSQIGSGAAGFYIIGQARNCSFYNCNSRLPGPSGYNCLVEVNNTYGSGNNSAPDQLRWFGGIFEDGAYDGTNKQNCLKIASGSSVACLLSGVEQYGADKCTGALVEWTGNAGTIVACMLSNGAAGGILWKGQSGTIIAPRFNSIGGGYLIRNEANPPPIVIGVHKGTNTATVDYEGSTGPRKPIVFTNDFTQFPQSAGLLGFYGATPTPKLAVTGSRGGNAALASLLTQLATLGLITDTSST